MFTFRFFKSETNSALQSEFSDTENRMWENVYFALQLREAKVLEKPCPLKQLGICKKLILFCHIERSRGANATIWLLIPNTYLKNPKYYAICHSVGVATHESRDALQRDKRKQTELQTLRFHD